MGLYTGSILLSNPAWRGSGTVSNTVIRNVTALSVRASCRLMLKARLKSISVSDALLG